MNLDRLRALSLPLQQKHRLRRLSRLILALILLPSALAPLARAQGGPPFRTDDPDTPGNKHWEINFGFIGDRNPKAGAYQLPDIDINYGLGDRIQLKYEVPLAIEETRALPASPVQPATPGQVIGGLGESVPGIKWRFYEHHPNDPWLKNRFGTGLLGVFGHHPQSQPTEAETPSPAAASEPVTNFSISTYPQLFLDNPTRSVPRGVVPPGPNIFLPIEINGRIGPLRYNADAGYNFGNHALPQSWNRGLLLGHEFSDRTEAYIEIYDIQEANRIRAGQGFGQFATGNPKQRETTLDIGGRQALNHSKTLNLLLMAGRSFQTVTAATNNSQPGWIAYVGVQVLFGPAQPVTPQVEQKLPKDSKR
jgi:hypothetical protein